MSGITLEQVQGDQVDSSRTQNPFLANKTLADSLSDRYIQPPNMNQQANFTLTASASDGLLSHDAAGFHLPVQNIQFHYQTSEWSNATVNDPHASFVHGYSGEGQQAPSFIPDHHLYRPSTNGFANSYGYSYGWNPMVHESNSSQSLNHQNVPNGAYNNFLPQFANGAPAPADFLRSGETLPNTAANSFGFHSETATPGFNRHSVNNSLQTKDLLPKVSEPANFAIEDLVDTRMAGLSLASEQLTSPFSMQLSQQGRILPTAVQSNSILSGSPVIGTVGSRVEPKTLSSPAVAAPAPVKKHTWASIASRPAKAPQPQVKPKPAKSTGGFQAAVKAKDGTPQVPTFGQNSSAPKAATQQRWTTHKSTVLASGPGQTGGRQVQNEDKASAQSKDSEIGGATLELLKSQNDYNPKRLTIDGRSARFFVIKSYSEDDIHRSIKYNIWCSTEHGNKRLDLAFREQKGKGPVILLFSVNGSGHFCGVAEMLTQIDYSKRANFWSQDKWKGKFKVKWIYAKDVPNNMLRHIRLENNENKPVTNSRDTQEVPVDKGCQVLKIISQYKHQTSIFDDFAHYEKRQEEEENLRKKRMDSKQQREKDGSYSNTSKEK